MVKADVALSICPSTGKVLVPAGISFADLYKVWRLRYAEVDRLLDRYDEAPGGWTTKAEEHFQQERDRCHLIARALWEHTVVTPDELVCLAALDLTYQDSVDASEGVLARAVMRVLGGVKPDFAPAALFDPVKSPRIGLTVGR